MCTVFQNENKSHVKASLALILEVLLLIYEKFGKMKLDFSSFCWAPPIQISPRPPCCKLSNPHFSKVNPIPTYLKREEQKYLSPTMSLK